MIEERLSIPPTRSFRLLARNSRACSPIIYNSCIYIARGLAEIYGGETDAIAVARDSSHVRIARMLRVPVEGEPIHGIRLGRCLNSAAVRLTPSEF